MSKTSAVLAVVFFLALGTLLIVMSLNAFRTRPALKVVRGATAGPLTTTAGPSNEPVILIGNQTPAASVGSTPSPRGAAAPTGAPATPQDPHALSPLPPQSLTSSEPVEPVQASRAFSVHQPLGIASAPPMVQAHPELPPGVPYASSTDPVRIQSINFWSDAAHLASARIITTSNAAALTARVGNYQVNVPKVAPGTFVLNMTVPHVPVMEHRVDIVVTAVRADGATVQRTVSVTVDL